MFALTIIGLALIALCGLIVKIFKGQDWVGIFIVIVIITIGIFSLIQEYNLWKGIGK